MIRKSLVVLLSLLVSAIAFAGSRSVESDKRKPDGATVSGVVSSVSGNLIHLAGGLVTIDATNAKILTDRGKDSTLASIEPGMLVFAALTSSDVAANAPLPAAMVTATRLPEAALFGPVQSVDVAGSTLTLLGRTIHVTPDTSFGGAGRKGGGTAPGLSDILPNHIVQVTAEESGGKLVATSVLVLAPIPTEVHAARGKVKTIGADSWVIERDHDGDLTLQVNAQTKIVGSPKVGDQVEVLYRVDTNNSFVAISIVKFDRPSDPSVTRIHGKVEVIESAKWVVAGVTLKIDEKTKIERGIAVGDQVEVLALKHGDGTLTAIAIVKKRF